MIKNKYYTELICNDVKKLIIERLNWRCFIKSKDIFDFKLDNNIAFMMEHFYIDILKENIMEENKYFIQNSDNFVHIKNRKQVISNIEINYDVNEDINNKLKKFKYVKLELDQREIVIPKNVIYLDISYMYNSKIKFENNNENYNKNYNKGCDELKKHSSIKHFKCDLLKTDYKKIIKSDNLISLQCKYQYEYDLNKFSVGSNVKYLVVPQNFDGTLTKKIIPKNLEYLELGYGFNNNSINNVNHVPYISFGKDCEYLSEWDKYNNSLTSHRFNYKFGNNFNQPLNNILHRSKYFIVSLFMSNFNCILNIGEIPSTVKYLHFGTSFNKTINVGVLPNSIEKIVFGQQYNKYIGSKVIPNSVKTIIFNDKFNSSVEFNDNIETIIFGNNYNQVIHRLPKNLKHLTIKHKNYRKDGFKYISTIKNLETLSCDRRLYNQIKHLIPHSTKVTYI